MDHYENKFHKKDLLSQKKEQINQGELLDFDKLSEAQMSELKLRIEKCQGRIITYIHPYFPEEHSFTDIGNADDDDLKQMREFLPRLLRVQKESTPPTLIFHDAKKINELEEIIGTKFAKNAYVLPTEEDNPKPENGTWEELRDKLKLLGVKRVMLAGMNLVVVWPNDDQEPMLDGCVPIAADELSKEFKISMLKRTYPNSSEDYFEYGGSRSPEDHLNFEKLMELYKDDEDK